MLYLATTILSPKVLLHSPGIVALVKFQVPSLHKADAMSNIFGILFNCEPSQASLQLAQPALETHYAIQNKRTQLPPIPWHIALTNLLHEVLSISNFPLGLGFPQYASIKEKCQKGPNRKIATVNGSFGNHWDGNEDTNQKNFFKPAPLGFPKALGRY